MPAPAPVKIGSYEIVGELGRGGMGIVYDARDSRIGRNVALKTILWRELGDDNERAWLRDRLYREARSAGGLNHPGIVTIYDVGEDYDRAFIAMERVEGPTLAEILGSGRVTDRATLLNILEQSADALDFAHEHGVVHRDVKPANIMLHRNSRVKIADFGIAKVLATQHHTKTGLVMGTPSYMSPEQIKGETLDGRSDQFSLAVIAFEMLSGQKPFDGDSLPSLVHKIVYEEPRSLRELKPALGAGVDTVLRKAFSKNAADRYPTCAVLVRALHASLQSTLPMEPLAPPVQQTNRSIARWVVALTVSSFVFFGVGYFVGRGSNPLQVDLPKQPEQRTVKQTEQPPPQTVPQQESLRPHHFDVEPHLRKAEQLQQQGLYDPAIAEYDAILKADPSNLRAKAGRAKAIKAKQAEGDVFK